MIDAKGVSLWRGAGAQPPHLKPLPLGKGWGCSPRGGETARSDRGDGTREVGVVLGMITSEKHLYFIAGIIIPCLGGYENI